jgi:hypothetical protein
MTHSGRSPSDPGVRPCLADDVDGYNEMYVQSARNHVSAPPRKTMPERQEPGVGCRSTSEPGIMREFRVAHGTAGRATAVLLMAYMQPAG